MSLQKRLSTHGQPDSENVNDMTSDLSSLNFETALSPEELQYLPLRVRHHCFSVTSCAYAVYIVSTFNELRQILSEMRNPINKKTIKFFKQTVPRNPIKVGIIGCGRLGKQIVSSLLAFSDVKTEEIMISTRRPSLLSSFHDAGISCIFDNQLVVSECNVVFLCCLPSQVTAVAESIVGRISDKCIICSYVTGIGLPRLKQLLRHNGITKIDYTWSINNAAKPWCLGDDVVTALKKEVIADVTFPLSHSHQTDCIVWANPKVIETTIYGCLNMCPSLGVTTAEALNLINMVYLGTTDFSKSLLWKNLLDEDSLDFVANGNLPVFDLFHIGTQDTPLTAAMKSEESTDLLTQKYKAIFNKFKNSSQPQEK